MMWKAEEVEEDSWQEPRDVVWNGSLRDKDTKEEEWHDETSKPPDPFLESKPWAPSCAQLGSGLEEFPVDSVAWKLVLGGGSGVCMVGVGSVGLGSMCERVGW